MGERIEEMEEEIMKYCEADVIALAEVYAKREYAKMIRRMKRKIHNTILRTIDFMAVMSWMIGACAVDCESNDMRIVMALIVIPMIWGGLRCIAEEYGR